MEVSPQSIWSILVLAQGVQGILTSTSAPTPGPLPSASAQTYFAASDKKSVNVSARASVEIVQSFEWQIHQKITAGLILVGGIRVAPHLRLARKTAGKAEDIAVPPLWIADLP